MERKARYGFTLPELLTSLCVAAILFAGAVPGFTSLIQRLRMDGAQQAFLTALAFARQEAIKRNTDVALCPSRDGATCLDAGDWHLGWIVFEDGDEDRAPAPGELVLRRHGPLDEGITLTSSKYRRVIAFQPLGSAGGSNATFTFCDHNTDAPPQTVVLSVPGRVRWAPAEDAQPPCGHRR